MSQDLINALITLGVLVIGALGTLVKVLVGRLSTELQHNTSISTQARDSSNGRLSEVIDRLAASRDQVQGLRWLVRERDDRIAYIVARLPEAEALMKEYRDRRNQRIPSSAELTAEQHVMDASTDS